MKRGPYTRTISDNIAEHRYRYSQRESERDTGTKRRTYIHVQSVTIQPNTITNIQREKDTQTQWRDLYGHTMSRNIVGHCYRH